MNITRNLTAAALIFLIFLMIPIYLDFIGVYPEELEVPHENNVVVSPAIHGSVAQNNISSTEVYANNVDEQIIYIQTNLMDLALSNRAGGSLLQYRLVGRDNQESLKYIGSYNEMGEYNSQEPVLLHSDLMSHGCSPCISLDNRSILINMPFMLMTPIENKTIFLSGDQKLQLHYQYKNELGDFVDKYITIQGDSYNITSTINFNLSKKYANKNIELSWLSGIMPAEKMEADELSYSGAYISSGGDLESITQSSVKNIDRSIYNEENVDWFAIRNKFFVISMFPKTKADYAILSSTNGSFGGRQITPIYEASLGYNLTSGSLDFSTYLGPLDVDLVNDFNSDLELIMNFGWSIIKPFSKLVVWILKTMRDSMGINYGVILIFFALLMRIVMGPLTRKGYESSLKMKTVAPLQKEIQEKYKNDPARLQQELGKLWKKHGFNPAMSCIAPLLQMPLLMSFFIVFRSTVEFRGQPFFLWIQDLSQPDYIFSLPFSIPLYGSSVAILPILMGISMFLTMRVSMQSAEDSQKYIMYFMNGFFILIFNTFPSGLTLYYTVYNFLSYQQQLSIKKNS